MRSTPNRPPRPSLPAALLAAVALAIVGTVAVAARTHGRADAVDDAVRTAAAAARSATDDPAPPSPYIWPSGPSADPTYFPIAVWLQSPSNAQAFAALGINLFIGLWEGPTDAQLDALTLAGMPVIADQNDVALARRGASTATGRILQGWMQQDEPDNAQSDGQGGWGPCVDPAEIIARYERMKAADPDRPVWLNLGQGVAWDLDRPYYGRGSACAGRWDQYREYVKGADIVSFDIYPVTSPDAPITGDLSRVALGVDRLREWTEGEKIVWNVVETTHIGAEVRPTPAQLRAEVWMSLVHGSMGIVYFVHEWFPRFREPALLDYPDMRAAVTDLNRQIRDLAPVLNSPSVDRVVAVAPDDPSRRVDVMVKRTGGWLYVLSVAMTDDPSDVTFRIDPAVLSPDVVDGAGVEVIDEGRTVALVDGSFRDAFGGYGVHLYRVRIRPLTPTTPEPESTPATTSWRLVLPWLQR